MVQPAMHVRFRARETPDNQFIASCHRAGPARICASASHNRPLISFDIQMVSTGYSICMSNRKAKTDVLQGTLDVMILQTLVALGPSHGYAIAARLEQLSGGALQLNMGTLYPALMRLEQRALVRGQWDVTESNRRARFYQITAAGRKQLVNEKAEWDRMVSIMRAVLREQN